MLAVGCLVPFALLGLGAAVGSYIGADQGGYWGAGIGFAAGLVLVALAFWLLERSRGG